MTETTPRLADDQSVIPAQPVSGGGAAATPLSRLGHLGDLMEELSAFARIGADSPATGAGAELPVRLEGFDCFVAEPPRSVLEARIDSAGCLVIRPGTPNHYPEPNGSKTVVVGVGRDQVVYTVARHWIDDTNRFGQNSADFPFCLVNLPARRRAPCDLRLAEWYRTEQEAIEKYAPAPLEPEPLACTAMFADGVQIELRRDTQSRWDMWETRYGRAKRRGDFTGAFLDHAKRTAVHWYGEPLAGWQTAVAGLRPAIDDVRHGANTLDLWSEAEEGEPE